MLREKAEARMVMGGGWPGEFASDLSTHNSALSRGGESLSLASFRTTQASPVVSRQMRRLFGPCGGAARQDVLVPADLDAAWVAFRRAKRERGKGQGGRGSRKRAGGKQEEGRRTMKKFNRKTGGAQQMLHL